MREPGIVKYYDHEGLKEFQYEHGSFSYPAGKESLHVEFIGPRAPGGPQKLTIKASKLGPGEKVRLEEAWHKKPYRDKVFNAPMIELYEHIDFDGRWSGLPNDHERTWELRHVSVQEAAVHELSNGAMLSILNNEDVVVRGKPFEEAVLELFPHQPIAIYYPTVVKKEIRKK
jgi:hypothetical protein